MSARLRQLLAEIEAAPSMRPACERWAADLRAELAEREGEDDTDHLEDDLRARAKRAGLERDSIGWSHRLSQVRVVACDTEGRWWWAPESDGTDTRRYRGTEEEALVAYLDSLVFEPMRLAHAIREYLDRAGIVVDHGAERVASDQARQLERLLTLQTLGPLADTPIEELLSVALDLAEERGEYSEGLRKQVARHLGALKLCTPWNTEANYGRTIRSAATGEELILALETRDNDDDTEWLTYSVHFDGRTSWVQSWARVEEIAGEGLRANGWVQVQAQPEEAEPTTDERSYAPEDLPLEEEAP